VKLKINFIASSIVLIASNLHASSSVSIEPYAQSEDEQAVRQCILGVSAPVTQNNSPRNKYRKAINDLQINKYIDPADQKLLPIVNNTSDYYTKSYGVIKGAFIGSYKLMIEQKIVGAMTVGSRDFGDSTKALDVVIFLPKQYGDIAIPEVVAHLKQYKGYAKIVCFIPCHAADFQTVFEKCGFEDIPNSSRFRLNCNKQDVSIEPYVQSEDEQVVRQEMLNLIAPAPQNCDYQNEYRKSIDDCKAIKCIENVDQQMMPLMNNTYNYYTTYYTENFDRVEGTFIGSYKLMFGKNIVGVMAVGLRDFVDGTKKLDVVIFLPKRYRDAVIPELITHLKKYTDCTEIDCSTWWDVADFKAVFEEYEFEDLSTPGSPLFRLDCYKHDVEIEPYVQSNDEQAVRQWALDRCTPSFKHCNYFKDQKKAAMISEAIEYVDQKMMPIVNNTPNNYSSMFVIADGTFVGSYKFMAGQSIVGIMAVGSQDLVGNNRKLRAVIFLPRRYGKVVIPEIIAHFKKYTNYTEIICYVPCDRDELKPVFEKYGFEYIPECSNFKFHFNKQNVEPENSETTC